MKKAMGRITMVLALVMSGQVLSADLANGEQQFTSLCVSCHGEKGHGDGVAGKALSEAPSNIYDGLTSFWESEAELMDTVLNGNEGMPAWKSVLSENDVKDIFAYIRQINQ
ncbi:cytochrome c [Vibrio sp. SCSIO 43135]|uniref:c-type cytochrome n=1 Tax=Vibrio sp. SCSIO 43135 TaxID=2819096 RepID=UPI002075E5DA|nr:cytochrome c [Vibrio sp. SCSIO 43135]USD43347.1 cytochrome c [Vibrio sp. SCSIO 43135]